MEGQRTHIFAFCCECDELDNAVDQCLKGKRVPREKLRQICLVVSDRIRIPWIEGARKVELDVFVPLLFLSGSLYFACYGLMFSVLTFVYTPLFVLIYYFYVLNQRKRTWFFVSWALFSLVGTFGCFLVHVSPYYSYIQSVIVSSGFIVVLLLYLRVVFSRRFLEAYTLDLKPLQNGVPKLNGKDFQDLTCCFCTKGPFNRSKHCRYETTYSTIMCLSKIQHNGAPTPIQICIAVCLIFLAPLVCRSRQRHATKKMYRS